MSGDLQTRPATAADLVFLAENVQEYVGKSVSRLEKDNANLREQVRVLQEAVVEQFASYKGMVEMIKLVARQPGVVDEDKVAALTKGFFFAEEATVLRAITAISQRMDNLAASPIMEFHGSHVGGKEHFLGNCVQKDGRAWVCTAFKTRETPGKSEHWRSFAICKE